VRGTDAPALVLMYHRVADLPRDTHDLCVHPDRFEEQVAMLRRREDVVSLMSVLDGGRRRRVAITFDDGYADNALVAAPVLAAAGLPATFFVASALLASGGQWWDELEQLLFDGEFRSEQLRIMVGGRSLTCHIGSDAARARAHAAIYRRLRPCRAADIADGLAQVRTQLSASLSLDESYRFMTVDQLRMMAARDGLDIGGHTRTHQQLSMLDAEGQRDEIVGGRAELASMLGCEPRTFAYPFGGPDAFDTTSESLAEAAGYHLACAGWSGVVRQRSPRYRLPRVVVKDWTGEELAARIDAWFDAA
jgi:peptidoglycan/xylan/chitin deacetylase (PgdA/CDA1 family)